MYCEPAKAANAIVEGEETEFLDKASPTPDEETREALVEMLIREDGDASAITIHEPFAAVIGNGTAYYQTWAHRQLLEHKTGFSPGGYTFRWAEDATHSQDQTRINR